MTFLWKFILTIFCALALCHCATNKDNNDSNDKEQKIKIAEINIQLGMGYLAQNNIQRAKQKLLLAVNAAPQLPEAWYSLAYFQEVTNNITLANQYYLKAIQLEPSRGDSQNNYGTFLCHTGQYQAAIQRFKLATQDPNYLDSGAAYENAGLCALKIPDQQQAAKYFSLALEQDPKRTLSRIELSKIKSREGS